MTHPSTTKKRADYPKHQPPHESWYLNRLCYDRCLRPCLHCADVTAKNFVEENTQIPSGTSSSLTTQFALIGIIRLPEEQGHWAAETALKILHGQPVNSISFATNKQGKLVINLRLGNKLKITFKPALLRTATILH